MLAWATLIVAGLWLLVQWQNGTMVHPLAPTPTPTRTANSYAQEGQALFEAGNLDGAILAYQQAVALDPTAAHIWAEMARIQTYSSSLQTTDEERYQRLQDAMFSITQAVEIDPTNSTAHAIKAFVLDWYAAASLTPDEDRDRLLTEALNSAVQATQLDKQNVLGKVYYAEVLLDQQNWSQAQQTIEEALASDPSLMDAHRVNGQVMETLGLYRAAIESYEEAVKITPNMTFLYIYIGLNYRHLQVYNRALEYFDRAARINAQNGVQDPLPYIAIAKTYSQLGEFFIAARNAETALEIDPLNANTYGQLGIIYVKSRNYEGALPVFKCVVYGCEAAENEVAGIAVTGLPLSNIEVAYYYVQYGTVLASLNMCDEAEPVLAEVMGAFGGDPVIASIVAESRAICLSFESGE